MLDHFRVVVGGQERLTFAAVRHRQPAHEVRHPGERGALQFRILVQEVVDVPGFVADHEVVLTFGDRVMEDHEVCDEDLVHSAERLEGVQVVVVGLGGDVSRFARQVGAERVDPLAARLEDRSDRVLGEPIDVEVGVQAT